MSAPKKKDYLKNFEKQGKNYVYKGKHYFFDGGAEEQKRAYIIHFSLLAVLAVLVIGSGFFTGGGMKNTYYVIIPYIGEASALFASVWYSFKLLTKRGRVRDYVYLTTAPRLPGAFVITAFFAVAGIICSLAFSITDGFSEGMAQAIGYPAVKAAVAAAAIVIRNHFINLEWIEES